MTPLDNAKEYLYERQPPLSAVLTAALPAVASQLINMVYNMADTYFVGRLGDPDQVAAVALSAPAALVLTALANLFGIGGAGVFSRALARGDTDRAKRVSVFSFCAAAAVSVLISLIFGLFPHGAARLLGADAATSAYTRQYLFWVIVCGAPLSLLSMVMSHFVRADGAARTAGLVLSAGGLPNLGLDPLFMFGFRMGLRGAAAATWCSSLVTFLLFVVYFVRRRSGTMVSFDPGRLKPDAALAADVLGTGLPGMLQTLLASLSNAVLNNLTAAYGGVAVAAMGIVKKLDQIPMSVTIGFAQGIMPLLSYCHAAGKTERRREILHWALVIAVGFSLVCAAIYELIPAPLIRLFLRDAATVETGTPLLRLMCMATPLMAVGFLLITLCQSVGLKREGTVLSVLRKGAVDIPLMLVLGALIPLRGLACVQPVTELIAAAAALWLCRRVQRADKA